MMFRKFIMLLSFFHFRSLDLEGISFKITLVAAFLVGLSYSAQATKRSTPDSGENDQKVTQKLCVLDDKIAHSSTNDLLQECIEEFVKARRQGNPQAEQVTNNKITTAITKNSEALLAQPEQYHKAFRLLAAMQNVGVEEFVGSQASFSTELASEMIQYIIFLTYTNFSEEIDYLDQKLEQSRKQLTFSPRQVRNLITLQRVNKYFHRQIQDFTSQVKKFYITRGIVEERESCQVLDKKSFAHLPRLFPNCKALSFKSSYFAADTRFTCIAMMPYFKPPITELEIEAGESNCDTYIKCFLCRLPITLQSLVFNTAHPFNVYFLNDLTNLTSLDLRDNRSIDIPSVVETLPYLTKLTSLAFTYPDLFQPNENEDAAEDATLDGEFDLTFITQLPNLTQLFLYDDHAQEDMHYITEGFETGLRQLTGAYPYYFLRHHVFCLC